MRWLMNLYPATCHNSGDLLPGKCLKVKLMVFISLLLCLTGCADTGTYHKAPKPKPDLMVLKLESCLVGTGIKTTRIKNTTIFKLLLPRDISFEKNSDRLHPQFFQPLDAIARLLKAQPQMIAKIAGHTDIYGTLRYNQLLSEKRAQNIGTYLASRGIAKNRLQTAGYGVNEPVASNKKADGRAKNRRVEILLYCLPH